MLEGLAKGLAEAIEELEIPPQGDAIVEGIALHDRLGAAICAAVGDFDAAGCWEVEGASSMTAWLRHRGRQSGP